VVAHKQVPVGILLDAERPAAGIAEHHRSLRTHPHHVAVGQAGDDGSFAVDQHILRSPARQLDDRHR